MRGTCVDLIPAYLFDSRSLAEVERIQVVKCRDRVYKREFERFSDAYCFTNTHVMPVVVRQNICRDRVYKRDFERFPDAYCFTNAQGMSVAVRQNVCWVPVWT